MGFVLQEWDSLSRSVIHSLGVGFMSCRAVLPLTPALRDTGPELLAQLDGGAGIRAGMGLWSRAMLGAAGSARSSSGMGRREPQPVAIHTWIWSTHKPLYSHLFIMLQIPPALGLMGEWFGDPWPGTGGFPAVLHPTFPSISSISCPLPGLPWVGMGWDGPVWRCWSSRAARPSQGI